MRTWWVVEAISKGRIKVLFLFLGLVNNAGNLKHIYYCFCGGAVLLGPFEVLKYGLSSAFPWGGWSGRRSNLTKYDWPSVFHTFLIQPRIKNLFCIMTQCTYIYTHTYIKLKHSSFYHLRCTLIFPVPFYSLPLKQCWSQPAELISGVMDYNPD